MSIDYIFVLDSGATNHIVVRSLEEYMSEIRMLPHIIVIKSTNGGEMIATRAGKFMGDYGSGTISFEAFIVPGLKNNMLSVSEIIQKSCTVVFSKEKVTIMGRGGKHYIECEKGHLNLFLLKLNPMAENTKYTIGCQEFGEIISTSETSLWHRRLGHLNRPGPQVLNLPFSDEKCPQCHEGMIVEFPTPYTPQQNSKAEKMNLTLMNRVRTKYAETDQLRNLWGEAVCASAYKLNRSPTSTLQNRIPALVWFSENVFSKLRVFGSQAYMLMLPQEMKLLSRAKSMIMVGYSGGGYRPWDPLKEKIVRLRDVIFSESKVGDGIYTARYQGINIEEGNEHLNGKDCTEAKTDIEENGTKEVTKHGTPQQSSEESDEEFIGFEDPDKENNNRSKPNRTLKKPSHLQEYELCMAYCLYAGEPQDYEDTIKLGNGWEETMESEIKALELHQLWTPTKARLVAKGFQEDAANNVYAPGARLPTICLLISIAVSIKWKIRQPDVPTAFLDGYMDDDIYIKIPCGVKNEPGKVLKLKRFLYGLRSALRKWNERFHNFVVTRGMKRSASDFCLYFGENVWFIICVDDMLITGEKTEVENLIRLLKGEFKAKDLGVLSEFLGTTFVNDGDEVKMSHSSFINKILTKFNMILCKGVNIPMVCDFQVDTEEPVDEKFMFRQIIGSLIYLQQTQDLCLTFIPSPDDMLVCYSDSDWAGDKLDRKSVSGYVLLHGKNENSWASRKQETVAISTSEAEYIACDTAACFSLSPGSASRSSVCNKHTSSSNRQSKCH
ncbi:hypothetical protein PR048_013116 [Dryococelus australis]|uniref:Integrase catalytic domain-containing protein n=1 Tax=Dryococelus australis TaxID=614101 RepID=A0ABQ9HRA0_9NEOP|nr:hypothetical protein PR048_013116 [Dryococelus australis]